MATDPITNFLLSIKTQIWGWERANMWACSQLNTANTNKIFWDNVERYSAQTMNELRAVENQLYLEKGYHYKTLVDNEFYFNKKYVIEREMLVPKELTRNIL